MAGESVRAQALPLGSAVRLCGGGGGGSRAGCCARRLRGPNVPKATGCAPFGRWGWGEGREGNSPSAVGGHGDTGTEGYGDVGVLGYWVMGTWGCRARGCEDAGRRDTGMWGAEHEDGGTQNTGMRDVSPSCALPPSSHHTADPLGSAPPPPPPPPRGRRDPRVPSRRAAPPPSPPPLSHGRSSVPRPRRAAALERTQPNLLLESEVPRWNAASRWTGTRTAIGGGEGERGGEREEVLSHAAVLVGCLARGPGGGEAT